MLTISTIKQFGDGETPATNVPVRQEGVQLILQQLADAERNIRGMFVSLLGAMQETSTMPTRELVDKYNDIRDQFVNSAKPLIDWINAENAKSGTPVTKLDLPYHIDYPKANAGFAGAGELIPASAVWLTIPELKEATPALGYVCPFRDPALGVPWLLILGVVVVLGLALIYFESRGSAYVQAINDGRVQEANAKTIQRANEIFSRTYADCVKTAKTITDKVACMKAASDVAAKLAVQQRYAPRSHNWAYYFGWFAVASAVTVGGVYAVRARRRRIRTEAR